MDPRLEIPRVVFQCQRKCKFLSSTYEIPPRLGTSDLTEERVASNHK